jgi:hypothetical protein
VYLVVPDREVLRPLPALPSNTKKGLTRGEETPE